MGTHAALSSTLAQLGASPDAFRARVELVLGFLRETSLADLLDGERDGVATRHFLESFGAQVEHVGLMAAPGMTHEAIETAAAAAGFNLRPMWFPSRLVARELSSLCGEEVPTTIFRASAEGTRTRRVGLEVFVPNTDEARICKWIEDGVVSHVAIEIKQPHDEVFADVAARLEVAGLCVPAFLQPRPFFVPNPTDDLRTLYFDRTASTDRSRLEVFALGDLQPRPMGRRRSDTAT